MESLLIASSTNLSFQPSFLATPGLCSPYPRAKVLKCKQWNDVEKQPAKPLISQRKLLMGKQFCTSFTSFVARPQEGSDSYLVNAASEDAFEFEPSESPFKTLERKIDVFYRFSRLFAFIGTVSGIVSVSLLAVEKLSDFSPSFFIGISMGIAAAFFMHICNNGVNQLSDIEIDKINKPYLPLASGEYSIRTALILVLSSLAMSLWIGWISGSWPLRCYLLNSFLLWTAYSANVPFLRWKNSAFLAAFVLMATRVNMQLLLYFHMQTFVFGRPLVFTRPLIFSTIFLSIFGIVIAFLKDIPDVAGDKIHGVRSLAIMLGERKVFQICILLLQMSYLVGIIFGITSPNNLSKYITVAGHMLLAGIVWNQTKSVNVEENASMASIYMLIWRLIYAEYLLIPFVK